MFHAYAASSPEAKFEPLEFDPGPLGRDHVEVAVEYCGVCHSDLSMQKNEWGITQYPFVGGHEVAGRVVAVGDDVQGLEVGQRVGIGWTAASCLRRPPGRFRFPRESTRPIAARCPAAG